MELGTTHVAEVVARSKDYGKSEDSCFGETTCDISSGVCFVQSGNVSPLVELIGVYGGTEISSTIGVSYGNIYGKLEVYIFGE